MKSKHPSHPQRFVAGVDLGGTKIIAGIFNHSLKILGEAKITTKADRGPKGVMARIVRCIQDAADEADLKMRNIEAVGVGAPGAVDAATGRVLFAPNLNWHNVPLKTGLEKALHRPVFVENDCSLCTLGIHRKEFAGRPRHMVGIFLGTGIGGGLILNGELFTGSAGTAGELGHMVMNPDGPLCQCGNRGCLEAFAGRVSMVKLIEAAIRRGETSILSELGVKRLRTLRSGAIRRAVQHRDTCVKKVVAQAAVYVGKAAANVINLLNPEAVVLGGGIIEALDDFMMPIVARSARKHLLPGTNKQVKIVSTQLGDYAGITGGAVLAWQGLEHLQHAKRIRKAKRAARVHRS